MRRADREQARAVSAYADELMSKRHRDPTERPAEAGLGELLDITRALSRIRIATPEALDRKMSNEIAANTAGDRGLFAHPAQRSSHRLAWTVIPASAVGIVALVVWVVMSLTSVRVSASELLELSTRAEAATVPRQGFVSRRTYRVTTLVQDGRQLESRYVEAWSDPLSDVTVRRLYNAHRRLMAFELTTADGSRIVYARGTGATRERASTPKPLTADDIWRWEPSPSSFAALAGNSQVQAKVIGAGFSLVFAQTSGPIASLELTLNQKHLSTEQKITLRQDDGTMTVHRTVRETTTAVDSTMATTAFAIDPELLPPPPHTGSPPPVARVSPDEGPPLLDLLGLELETRWELDKLDSTSCLASGEWRGSGRTFAVRVLLTADRCVEQATSVLSALKATPGVSVDISVGRHSESEAAARLATSSPVTRESLNPALLTLLADRQPQSPDNNSPLDTQALDFAQRLNTHATNIKTLAAKLQLLCDRWSAATLQRLGPSSAGKWKWIARDTLRALALETDAVLSNLRLLVGGLKVPRPDRTRRWFDEEETRRTIAEISRNADLGTKNLERALFAKQKESSAIETESFEDLVKLAELAHLLNYWSFSVGPHAP